MAKSKVLSRSGFITALVLARPAWATGLGGNGVDDVVPFSVYAIFLSLACFVAHALVRRHERRRALRSLDDGDPSLPALSDREGFFGAIQFVVTLASIIVSAGFFPAVFFTLVPFAYTLVRRKYWLGLGLLLGAAALSVPPFLVFMIIVLSV